MDKEVTEHSLIVTLMSLDEILRGDPVAARVEPLDRSVEYVRRVSEPPYSPEWSDRPYIG